MRVSFRACFGVLQACAILFLVRSAILLGRRAGLRPGDEEAKAQTCLHDSDDSGGNARWVDAAYWQNLSMTLPPASPQIDECSFETLSEYVTCRMKADNRHFGHFADRRWVNQWSRNEQCGVGVPRILCFFPASDQKRARACLRAFVAPSGGAVVKLNHQAGSVVVLKEGSSLGEEHVEQYIAKMSSNYVVPGHELEPHYQYADKGVIIESLLQSGADGGLPQDHKFYVFDGVSPHLVVMAQRKTVSQAGVEIVFSGPNAKQGQELAFDPRMLNWWSRLNSSHMLMATAADAHFEKPCGWQEMTRAVECLSQGFTGVRIDLFLSNCRPYLGEITVTPAGGKLPAPRWYDQWLGSFISRGIPYSSRVLRHQIFDDTPPPACIPTSPPVVPPFEEVFSFAGPGLPAKLRDMPACVWLVSDDLQHAHVHDGLFQGLGLVVGGVLFRKQPFLSLAPAFQRRQGRCAAMHRASDCCTLNFFRYRGATFAEAGRQTPPAGATIRPVRVATLLFCEALRRVLRAGSFNSVVEVGAGSGAGGSCAAHFGKERGLQWVGLLDSDPASADFIRSPMFGLHEPAVAISPLTSDVEAYRNASVQLWVADLPTIPTTWEMQSRAVQALAGQVGWHFGLKRVSNLLQSQIDSNSTAPILTSLSSLSLRSPPLVAALNGLCRRSWTLQVVLDRELLISRSLADRFPRVAGDLRSLFESPDRPLRFGSTSVCGRDMPTGLSLQPSQCLPKALKSPADPPLPPVNVSAFDALEKRAFEGLLRRAPQPKSTVDPALRRLQHPSLNGSHAYHRLLYVLLRPPEARAAESGW